MPYYTIKNFDILLPKHILFIHIPKTGGTTLESYLNNKYSQFLINYSPNNKLIPETQYQNKSLQHQFYTTIYKYRDILNVNFDDELKIITIVRNPYHRLVSDLFYFNLINKSTNCQKVYDILKNYIHSDDWDNHNMPQYKFITDENETLINNITIFKTENLTNDIINYGFSDYDNRIENKGSEDAINYMKYLNYDSIKLINQVYLKDFELFDYKII
jgi:hypothetical protein